MNTCRGQGSKKAGLISKKAWLQSLLENVVFSTIKYLNSLSKT